MESVSFNKGSQIYELDQNGRNLARRLLILLIIHSLSLILGNIGTIEAQESHAEETIIGLIDSLRTSKYETIDDLRLAHNKFIESFAARDDLPEIWAFYRFLLRKTLEFDRPDYYNTVLVDIVSKYNSLGQGQYAQELLLDSAVINNNLKSCVEKIRLYLALSSTYDLIYHQNHTDLRIGVLWARRALLESERCDHFQRENVIYALVNLYSKCDLDSADYFMQEAINLGSNAKTERLRGRLERKKGNHFGELKYMRRSVGMAKNDSIFRRRLLTNWEHPLAVAYRNNGILDSAMYILNRVLDTSHSDVLTRTIIPSINIGILFAKNGNSSRAIKHLERAYENARRIGAVYHVYESLDWLTQALKDEGRYKELAGFLNEEIEFERARYMRGIINIHAIESFKSELDDYRAFLKQREVDSGSMRIRNLVLIFGLSWALMTAIFFLSRKLMLRKNRLRKEMEFSRLSLMNAQFNPHFLFNSLMAITAKAREIIGVNGPNELGLFSLSNLLRSSLKSINNVVISLETEIELIKGLVELENMRRSEDFILDVKGFSDGIRIISGFIQPFVENALRHAYPMGAESKVIQIIIQSDSNRTAVIIQDNGIGFEMDSIDKKSSFGIINVQRRMKLMNQIVWHSVDIQMLGSNDDGTAIKVSFTSLDKELSKLETYFNSLE